MKTPLHSGVSGNHVECVRALINAGANLNIRDVITLLQMEKIIWEGVGVKIPE